MITIIKALIAWGMLGALAGAIARYVMPGKDKANLLETVILGILGALLGAVVAIVIPFLSLKWSSPLHLNSILSAILGSVILLGFRRYQLGKKKLEDFIPEPPEVPPAPNQDSVSDLLDIDKVLEKRKRD